MMNLLLRFSPLLFISASFTFAQTGGISGRVFDKTTKEGLPGATVSISGSSRGEVTDVAGNFLLLGLKPGTVRLEVRYIGYRSQQLEIMIEAGTVTDVIIGLELDATVIDEIVITSQALGQAGAINQQINASTIVNVVSKERIRELPDQNAAETVGRISGIYVQRDAGEGQKVVVRGLAPRFNNITINGQRIPSTDANDRSVDLSMISPAMLSGIEVYKAARPDQDGDAIGGTVNFSFKKATEEPELWTSLQTGYNSQEREFGQYKVDLSYGKRYMKNKIGVYITGNYQRANRSSDQLRGDYQFLGEDVFGQNLIQPAELELSDIVEIRKRYGGNITTDFTINQNHIIIWDNMFSYTDRDEVRRRRRYRWSEQRQEFEIRDRIIKVGLLNSALRGDHKFKGGSELLWSASYSNSTQNLPESFTSRFREVSAFNSTGINLTGQPLDSLTKLAVNNVNETFLNQVFLDNEKTDDRMITLQIDYKIPLNIHSVNGFFKAGLKFRDNERIRERNSLVGNYFSSQSRELAYFINDFPGLYQLTSSGGIAITNFLSGFYADNFLGGNYYLGPGAGETNGPGLNRNQTSGFIRNLNSLNYLAKDFLADIDDYKSTETITSGYAMTELNLTTSLTILAGVRIEQTKTTYRGNFMLSGFDYDDGGAFESLTKDSTGGRTYTEFLPMIHFRYKVNDWFDLRGAATRTLARPDFTNLIPLRRINNNDQTIRQADPQLLHTTAWNYDLSFYAYNKYGLLTISGFYKLLKNIDYNRVFTKILPVDDPFVGYEISSPVNSTQNTKIYGGEIDLQANLRFLPKPFSNFIIAANLTLLRSETFYPFIPAPQRLTEPPYTPFAVLDAFRAGRAPRQANLISNISIGYEYKGFSGRISMVHQGNTLAVVGPVPALDSYTGGNTRFDMTLKQKLRKNLSIYFNWNNLTNAPELAFLGNSSRTTEESYYGFTADLGLQYKF
ncbi:MAG: TonB-dependent receptor [Cyclobacteriaceae bacterium]|nr:MAG: TonB-dependent receptor [Cyclobacteriaceae bacterium]